MIGFTKNLVVNTQQIFYFKSPRFLFVSKTYKIEPYPYFKAVVLVKESQKFFDNSENINLATIIPLF